MKNVRTIIWDLDETLWFYKNNETEVLCKKLNIDDLETFTEQYYEMWGSLNEYFKNIIVTYEGIRQWIFEKMPILRLYAVSEEEFLKAIREEKQKFITVNYEAVEIMNYVSKKGIRNISITDWLIDEQVYTLKKLNLHTYIREIYGCDDAYLKSSTKKVEEIARKILMGKHEEFLIIGDSLSSDIFFANQLGIKSVWYNRKGKNNETQNTPTIEVKSLLELKEIL